MPEQTPTKVAQEPLCHVYQAICEITGKMAATGIAKTRRNSQQGYEFRGIDDVYAALSRMLAESKLCVLPYVEDRTVKERETKNGGVLFYTVLTVDFHFVSAIDGSTHVVRTVGEAMDSGDKSTNKAMSAAYKYAALMTFCIPTEGDNDADNTTHEPVAEPISAENLTYLTQLNELEKGKPLVATIFKRAGVDAIAMLKEPMATEAVAWARKKIAALAAPATVSTTEAK